MRLPTGRKLYVASGTVAAALVVTLVTTRDEGPAGTTPVPSNQVSQTRRPQEDVPVVDVRIEQLKDRHVELGESERNPFRFKPRPAPAPSRPAAPAPTPGPVAPPVPTGPPPPPPIPLRFIGLVEAPLQAGRVAILSDGRGNVVYGKEGDIIEGRYRLVRIGTDAAELSYLDGRGRQTIRLSGQ